MRTGSILLIGLLACENEDEKPINDREVIVSDIDGDGYLGEEDCDDNDALVNPGAEEICDGIDNNCDDNIDEGVLTVYYADSDEDGFGNPEIFTESCDIPDGFVSAGTDCNDTQDNSHPGAEEICDGIDNDCDELIDEELSQLYYLDSDGDGFGDVNQPVEDCDLTEGLSLFDDDCDDQNAEIHPLASEVCDDIDNNCDGSIDEGVLQSFYLDGDGDGYGDNNNTATSCEAPAGYVNVGGDCDDIENFTNPQAVEYCDGADNDCDGSIDESGSVGEQTYYLDGDGDGFGEDSSIQTACSIPSDGVLHGGDCDDADSNANPSMIELCDSIDNNCDGSIDETGSFGEQTYYIDSDGDGFGEDSTAQLSCTMMSGSSLVGGDCDDTDSNANPSMIEFCDSIDNNCDGSIDEAGSIGEQTYYLDGDGDGFGDVAQISVTCNLPSGHVLNLEDCDDGNPLISPAIAEVCDNIDNDCDGDIDESDSTDANTWYLDYDGDGYGSSALMLMECYQPNNYVANDQDCDDTQINSYPGALEICDSIDNDCDGDIDDADADVDLSTATEYYLDGDGDGYGVANNIVLSCVSPAGTSTILGDCDDGNADISPGDSEVCDGVDNNCDNSIDEGLIGQAFACPATDCSEVLSLDPNAADGVYWIDPLGMGASENYCDLSSADGPWSYLIFTDIQAYWSFDGSNVLTADIGGATGTLYGNTSSSSGIPFSGFGNSLYSDNQDSGYAEIHNGPTLGSEWTVMFWGMNDNCSNNQIPIIFNDNSFLGDLYHQAALYYRDGGYYVFANHNAGCSSYTNTWRHFAYVNDGNSIRAWENGVEVNSITSYSYFNFSGYSLSKLMNYPGFGTNGLGGNLDDLAFVSRALSDSEIQSIYQFGTNGIPIRWQ